MPTELKSPNILVIDDDREIRYSLERVLSSRNYHVTTAASGEEGIERLKDAAPDVIFLDIRMGGMNGIATLQRLRSADPQAVVILMTAYGTTQTAIEAMKFGAFDYIMKPFDVQKVLQLTESARKARTGVTEVEGRRSNLNSDDYREGIVGRSGAMQDVFKVIGQAAPSDVTVLVTGESGTGKELVARSLHRHSARAGKPFVAVNCAAIPENLIESELFGHERGAFTGATGQRIGRFEECDGGTIFLDEIGDMALPTQTKILRVLQEGEIQRVGGAGMIKVDVRVVAATNRNLEEMVAARTFREDLYYRLHVVRLRLPPLRERMEDLPLLVDFLLQKLEKGGKARAKQLSADAMAALQIYSWPGNVRELENAVYRSAVMAQSDVILVRDLPAELQSESEIAASEAVPPPPVEPPPLRETAPAEPQPKAGESDVQVAPHSETQETLGRAGSGREDLFDEMYRTLRQQGGKAILDTVEREMVVRALKETQGNQAKASSLLGMTRTTLRKRIQEYAIKP